MDKQKLDVLYDLNAELQRELEKDVVQPIVGRYLAIKALAACYELRDYLANEIEKQK